MEKLIIITNFIKFAAPLSILLVCKVILPTDTYESLVNFTADKCFMTPIDNKGLQKMNQEIDPRKFLMWTTSNLYALKSTFSNMLLELGCQAHVGEPIEEMIEFVDYKTLNPIPMSKFICKDKPIIFNIGSSS